jgi:GT2 family glycosyltransferase
MSKEIEWPLVVVSIVNWNTSEHVSNCLRSVHAMTYPNYRVVVVDNHSRDDSIERIAQKFPSVELIRKEENVGFAAGHEFAIAHAESLGATAVWLLNSDAVVEVDALDRLIAAWHRYGDAVYGGLALQRAANAEVYLDFPEKYLDVDGAPHAFRCDRRLLFNASWREREPFRVGAVVGSSMLLPCALVRRVGWMDHAWFLYCEEIDYCYRLRKRGIASILVPQSRVWHVGGASHRVSTRVADCIGYYRTRNEIVLSRRYGAWYVFPCIVAKKALRAVADFVAHGARRGRMTMAGVSDAIRGRTGKTFAPEDFLENDR